MNKDKCQWEIVLNLLRYLPTSLSSTEYCVVGHDDACPRIDRSMLEDFDDPLSFFFRRIGDARNLYATVLQIDRLEQENTGRRKRTYHATINNIKGGALARDLVMFYLLDDLMYQG